MQNRFTNYSLHSGIQITKASGYDSGCNHLLLCCSEGDVSATPEIFSLKSKHEENVQPRYANSKAQL